MIYGLIVAISFLLLYNTIFKLMHISIFQEGTKSKPNYETNINSGPASDHDVLEVQEINKIENEIEKKLSDVNKKLKSLIISDITNITDLSKFKEMLKTRTVSKTFNCTPPGITYKQTLKTGQTACKPHVISKEACDFVRDQYWHDENMQTCGFSRKVEICTIKTKNMTHFQYKCSHTIEKINSINKDSETEILDFELFQSIHGHTVENLHALFTGQLFPRQWSDAQLEKVALGIGEMFGRFANSGYHTYYHDDLCYKEWWGLRMDLGSPTTWDQFAKRLKANHIQDTGNAIVYETTTQKLLQIQHLI